MPDIIDYRFRLRRGLKSTWQSLNDILLDGEIGLEKDTGFFKVGDGATPWNHLPYHVSGGIENFGTIQNGEVLVWASGKWEPGQAGGANYLVQNDLPLADGSEKNIVTSRTWKGLPLLFEDGLLVPNGEYDASANNNTLTFGSSGVSVGSQYSIVGSYEKADTTAIWATYELPYNLDVRWDNVQNELKLTWDFDGDDPDKFYIFRDDDPLDPGNMPSPIGDVDGTEREFFDDDINIEAEAYYRVGYYEGASLVLSADAIYDRKDEHWGSVVSLVRPQNGVLVDYAGASWSQPSPDIKNTGGPFNNAYFNISNQNSALLSDEPKSYFNFLHDRSVSYTLDIWFRLDSSSLGFLYDSNGGSSAKTGVSAYKINQNTGNVQVTRGVQNNFTYRQKNANGSAWPESGWHLFSFQYDQPNNIYSLFFDGVLNDTRSGLLSSSADSTEPLALGWSTSLTSYGCEVAEFRATKGVARYTANFTPPPAPFPNK